MTSSVFTSHTGVVVEFNPQSGLGSVETEGVRFGFHCIEIADGTRSIEVGVRVTFRVEPRLGSYEAVHLERLGA